MKTKDYCRALKAKLGVTSDYALAKHLQVRRQAVSNYVNGLRAFDTTMAVRVAELLELDPLTVIADVELERGSSPELWKRIRAAAAITGAMLAGALLYQAAASGFDINEIAAALVAALPLNGNTHWTSTADAAIHAASALNI